MAIPGSAPTPPRAAPPPPRGGALRQRPSQSSKGGQSRPIPQSDRHSGPGHRHAEKPSVRALPLPPHSRRLSRLRRRAGARAAGLASGSGGAASSRHLRAGASSLGAGAAPPPGAGPAGGAPRPRKGGRKGPGGRQEPARAATRETGDETGAQETPEETAGRRLIL